MCIIGNQPITTSWNILKLLRLILFDRLWLILVSLNHSLINNKWTIWLFNLLFLFLPQPFWFLSLLFGFFLSLRFVALLLYLFSMATFFLYSFFWSLLLIFALLVGFLVLNLNTYYFLAFKFRHTINLEHNKFFFLISWRIWFLLLGLLIRKPIRIMHRFVYMTLLRLLSSLVQFWFIRVDVLYVLISTISLNL